jgi:hypothetical protein
MIDLSDEKIYTHINESKNIKIHDKINNISINENKINKDINKDEDIYNNKNNIYLLITICIAFIIIYYFTKS